MQDYEGDNMTVKNQAGIDNPTVLTGYLVDGNMSVPLDDGNRHYQEVQVWIAEGNIPEDAYTQAELNQYAINQAYSVAKTTLNNTLSLLASDLWITFTQIEQDNITDDRKNAIQDINTGGPSSHILSETTIKLIEKYVR